MFRPLLGHPQVLWENRSKSYPYFNAFGIPNAYRLYYRNVKYISLYVYIYIYIERERERGRATDAYKLRIDNNQFQSHKFATPVHSDTS